MLRRSFQYLSDLHLERRKRIPAIKQIADNLLLAGDIGYPTDEIYQEFFKRCSEKYERVFVVDGNHEWDRGRPCNRRFDHLENVHLLENKKFVWEDIVVVGTTLWTESTRTCTHYDSVDYLQKTIQAHPDQRVIFLTHHLPSWQLIARGYRERYMDYTLGRYANHLDYFFYQKCSPLVWICGHSHSIVRKQLGQTKCMINTFGHKYPSHFEL